MKVFTKIMDVVAKIEGLILIVTGLMTTLITFLAVVGRKTAWYKFTWSEEIVINVFILMIMVGCALADLSDLSDLSESSDLSDFSDFEDVEVFLVGVFLGIAFLNRSFTFFKKGKWL